MVVRSAMHQAGAAALTELLQFPVPEAAQRNIPCACGHQAHYRELRSKPVLTAVGPAEVSRPYYLCSHCHAGQFPADVELDIEKMGYLLHSGRPYILWSAASVLAKQFTIDLYGAGPTATACSARRRKSFPRLREFRRLKRKVNSSR